ncbi:UNVERIFIED_CONTAM: hypothetical protein K2H54_004465 [Gekko kuhli]
MILRPASRAPWRALRVLSLILVLDPVGAWYKHVASPRYHTVGRASGLLMGVSRSPYLWRRGTEGEPGQDSDVAPSLPANRPSSQWPTLQQDPVEAEPWTALAPPHLASRGPPGKGSAGKRAFPQQASPRSQAAGNQLAVLQRQGSTWASRCPPGCQGMPWRRSPPYPALLERAMRKNEQPGSRVFKPEI